MKKKEYSEVFETMDYKKRIRMLEKYGIKHPIDWFKSYLNSWKQYAR